MRGYSSIAPSTEEGGLFATELGNPACEGMEIPNQVEYNGASKTLEKQIASWRGKRGI